MGMYFVKDWYCKPYKKGKTYKGIWVPKTWNNLPESFSPSYIWTDGNDIYYSNNNRSTDQQYKLNRSASRWDSVYWGGTKRINGAMVWKDTSGNTYHSKKNLNQLQLLNGSWTNKTWSGAETDFDGDGIWTDGDTIYLSYSDYPNYRHRILDESTSTWSNKKFYPGFYKFTGDSVWTDGDNTYWSGMVSSSYQHYVFDKTNIAWVSKTWQGYTSFSGTSIWNDNEHIYLSSGSNHYELDKASSTWLPKTWQGLTSFYGSGIWKDGDHIYYSSGSDQYELT